MIFQIEKKKSFQYTYHQKSLGQRTGQIFWTCNYRVLLQPSNETMGDLPSVHSTESN